ncbi:MAG: DUF5011 domain-containing protein, partial [Bacilli bacterium]|nr:DUF5011 domain-containing protein [Bacilli bacterium]
VRPVLTLINGLYVDKGNGTFDNPYTLKDIVSVDREKPVITMNGSSPTYVVVGSTYQDAGATAFDNIDGDLTSKIIVLSDVNSTALGTYSTTYVVSDKSGNKKSVSRIVTVGPPPVPADNSTANEPQLGSNMIPVMYYYGTWVKADKNNYVGKNSWYNYDEKKWANAVTVTNATFEKYADDVQTPIGTPIPEKDILTYFVWIPRYKYAIPSETGPRAINIVYEQGTPALATGTATDTSYRTHPAFDFGTAKLTGFWVGKFEVTSSLGDAPITVKPGRSVINDLRVSQYYTLIRDMKLVGNEYRFDSTEVDTHMIKNDEWGAVLYLSHSNYGINEEIYKNNSSFYTGISGGQVGGKQIKVGTNEYSSSGFYTYDGKCATTLSAVTGVDAYNKPLDLNCTVKGNIISDLSLAYKASTTGTIYGVYDMSGGSFEYVMGNYKNYSGYTIDYHSGFNGPLDDGSSVTNGIPFPAGKYYNYYSTNNPSTACSGICYGHGLSETLGWYEDYSVMVETMYPWMRRGGDYRYTNNSGAFGFPSHNGDAFGTDNTRVVVTMIN